MALVTFEKKQDVGIITLNNPKKLNALSDVFAKDLDDILNKVKKSALKVVLIRGEGKAFCSGGDIEFEQSLSKIPKASARKKLSFIQKTLAKIESLPQATIAIIHGYAIGGGSELAMACDIRVALPNAKFSHPEIKLGLVPPLGGTKRLVRLVGIGKAKYLLFTANAIDARTAKEWGLVDFVIAKKDLDRFLADMVKKISSYSPKALKLTKQLLNEPVHGDLTDSKEIEGYLKCSGDKYNKAALEKFLKR